METTLNESDNNFIKRREKTVIYYLDHQLNFGRKAAGKVYNLKYLSMQIMQNDYRYLIDNVMEHQKLNELENVLEHLQTRKIQETLEGFHSCVEEPDTKNMSQIDFFQRLCNLSGTKTNDENTKPLKLETLMNRGV